MLWITHDAWTAALWGCLTMLVVLALVAIVVGEWLGTTWPTIGTILLGYSVVAMGAFACVYCLQAWEGEKKFPKRAGVTKIGEPSSEVGEGINLVPWLIGGFIILCMFSVTYAEFTRHLYIAADGFGAPGTGVFQWLLFGAAEMADGLSFGLFSIFIDAGVHATAWWAKAFIVVPCHLLLATIVIADFLHGFKRLKARQTDS